MTTTISSTDSSVEAPSLLAGPAPWAPQGQQFLDLQLLVAFAARAVCHSSQRVHCGISLVEGARAPETAAATDDLPVRVDWLQQELRQGPAFNSHAEVVVAKDLAADNRWPDFGRMCVAVMGLCSMVSIDIPGDGPNRATLNFYSREPNGLDRLDIDGALRLARLAAPSASAIITGLAGPASPSCTGDYSLVAVALGTLMARHHLDSATAFDLLLRDSHREGVPLLWAARSVVEPGELPDDAGTRTGEPAGVRHGWRQQPPPRLDSVGGPEMWRDRSSDQPPFVIVEPAHHPSGSEAIGHALHPSLPTPIRSRPGRATVAVGSA